MAYGRTDSTSALSDNDPYRNMERSDIKPDLTGKKDKGKEAKIVNFDEAKKGLRGGEDAAVNNNPIDNIKPDNLPGANAIERNPIANTGLFTGTSKGGSSNNKINGKGKKKKGPLAAIVTLICMLGMLTIGGQSFQLVSWKENIVTNFGQNSALMNTRFNTIFRKMIGANRNVTSTTIFGNEKFKIKGSLLKKLQKNNIDYVETTDASGKKVKLLVYTDPDDGSKTPIAANSKDASRAPTSYTDTDGNTITFTNKAITLDEAKSTNTKFNTDLDTATLTITGKIAGWFDSVADIMFKRIGGSDSRNKLRELDDESTEEEVKQTLYENDSDGAEGVSGETSRTVQETDEDGNLKFDEDGNPIMKTEVIDDDGAIKPTDTPDTDSTAKSLKARAQKVAAAGGGIACMVLNGVGAINGVIGAAMLTNVIQFAMKYLEAADKIKAGDADASTNIIANMLNEPTTTTTYGLKGSAEEVEITGSAADSDGFNNAFSSKNIISEDDPEALSVNREYATKNALLSTLSEDGDAISGLEEAVAGAGSAFASFGSSIAAFQACNAIQTVTSIAGLVGDIVLVVTTSGIGNIVKEFAKGVVEGALLTGAMVALGAVVSAVTPMAAKWLASNLESTFRSKIGGFALESGGHSIQDSNLQMSTGVYADEDMAKEMFAMTKDVEKEWAAYDRATLSPFDVTSKYTFLGSLLSSSMPVINAIYSGGSIVSSLSSAADLAKDSLISVISPTVSAADSSREFSNSLASSENCPQLAAVGVAGDFACNKYSGAYLDDVESMDPYDVYLEIADNFEGEDEDGNPQIDEKSDYAKYIVACVANDVQPGSVSSNVVGYIQQAESAVTGDTTTGNAILSLASSIIPFSDAADIVDSFEKEANLKWNTGKACTDEEYRYFSTYTLDQRVLADMGVIEESSVTSFLEDYYEENPLDNSYEGIIARYSGMTKEEVQDTLALIEYIQYIADYDPSERYAFGEVNYDNFISKFINMIYVDDSEETMDEKMLLNHEISYFDTRNRHVATA